VKLLRRLPLVKNSQILCSIRGLKYEVIYNYMAFVLNLINLLFDLEFFTIYFLVITTGINFALMRLIVNYLVMNKL